MLLANEITGYWSARLGCPLVREKAQHNKVFNISKSKILSSYPFIPNLKLFPQNLKAHFYQSTLTAPGNQTHLRLLLNDFYAL